MEVPDYERTTSSSDLGRSPGTAQGLDRRPHARSIRTYFGRPELAPVLSLAMTAVIDLLELGERTPPDLIRELEDAAAIAMAEAYEPIADAASRLARANEASRTTEAADVRRKAETTAALVSDTAAALQQRQGRLTERVAEDATAAARALAPSSVPGSSSTPRSKPFRRPTPSGRSSRANRPTRGRCGRDRRGRRPSGAQLASEAEHAAVIVEGDTLQAVAARPPLDLMYEIAIDEPAGSRSQPRTR